MTVFFIAFLAMLLIVTAMSVGVLFANKPIKGSCGGMNALGMETECDVCGGDKVKCEKENERSKIESDASHFYDASK
jgi:hypothetical protein